MALSGSLADVSIVDLLGLLTAGQRSGELVIAGHESFATLQLHDGRLMAATADKLSGLEAVQALLEFREGEFELRHRPGPAAAPEDRAFHDAVMRLLGERAASAAPAPSVAPPPLDAERCRILAAFLAAHSFARFACTFDTECVIDAEAVAGNLAPREIRLLASSLCTLLHGHPRGTARRVVLEDDQGIVVGSRLPAGGMLMVMGDTSSTTGAVAAATTRLLARLTEAR